MFMHGYESEQLAMKAKVLRTHRGDGQRVDR
jgi:hypothetical protein